MSEENIDIELNADNLDTSEFWKSRDESTKITLNEKLLRIARNGPFSEFVSILEKESSSRLDKNDIYLIDLDIVDKSGWSPLIHASFNGHLSIVEHIICYQEQKYLREYGDELIFGSETDDEDSDDENENENEENEEILSELRWKYLFKKFLRRKVKWNGSTALHLGCARGHELIAKFLINKMLNEYNMCYSESINAIDYDMATPLHCAVLGKHYNICKLLLLNGGVVNKSDIRGKTPLDWATERGLNEYISLLSSFANKENDVEISVEREREKVVESIWEENEEGKSMEPTLTDNDILNVVINNQDYYERQKINYYNSPAALPAAAVLPHTNVSSGHGWYYNYPIATATHPNMHHNICMPHHNNHHEYRQRAPRHRQYYFTPPPQPLLVTSKSCPTAVDKNNNQKKEDEEIREEKIDNPAFDAMKFQNKYLKARCETLEKEHKELATEYKQQLMKENNRWRLREEKLLEQLDTKQKQIHELRHTLRRMRMFLDNLPVRMRRNFYRNNGNFSRELYENQQVPNNNQLQTSDKSSSENEKSPNITTNGWRTIITENLNQCEPEKNDKQNKKNKNNKRSNRFTDTFLFSKLSSNAARSRKCAMSDKSWRKKK